MNMNTKWKAIAGFAVILAGLMWFAFQPQETTANSATSKPAAQNTATQSTGENEAPMAPAFTLKNLEGDYVSLADYRGKVIFVNFWATWCPPCRQEIPHFVKLVEKYGEDGFVILGISVDDPSDFGKVPGFADSYNINYPILFGNQIVASQYGGIESIPTTFVIDREGRALGKIIGARPYEQFENIVKQVL